MASEYAEGTDVPPDVQLALSGRGGTGGAGSAGSAGSRGGAANEAAIRNATTGTDTVSVKQSVEHVVKHSVKRGVKQTAAPAATAAPTGLTVSGELTFSPAPKTSPYFTGKPMPIRGTIEVEGLVDGDGNLHIVNAPFTRR